MGKTSLASYEIKYLESIKRISETEYLIRLSSHDGHSIDALVRIRRGEIAGIENEYVEYGEEIAPYITSGMFHIVKVNTAIIKFHQAGRL